VRKEESEEGRERLREGDGRAVGREWERKIEGKETEGGRKRGGRKRVKED
jgi:hypothetical protein